MGKSSWFVQNVYKGTNETWFEDMTVNDFLKNTTGVILKKMLWAYSYKTVEKDFYKSIRDVIPLTVAQYLWIKSLLGQQYLNCLMVNWRRVIPWSNCQLCSRQGLEKGVAAFLKAQNPHIYLVGCACQTWVFLLVQPLGGVPPAHKTRMCVSKSKCGKVSITSVECRFDNFILVIKCFWRTEWFSQNAF